MVRVIFSLAATLALASAVAAPGEKANDTEKRYSRCLGAAELHKATEVSWVPQPSHIQDHRALREHLQVPIPEGASRILFWSFGMHHTAVSFSVIAVRDGQGQWHTNGVGEEGPGLLRIEPHPMKMLDRDLTAEQGRALDRLLADPCLYASPSHQSNPEIVAGGASQTVEIETPSHRWVASWFGIRTPQEDALINLITAQADHGS